MKKLLLILLSLMLAFGFTGCNQQEKELGEVRIGSLKGPTTIGLVNMLDKCEKGETKGKYTNYMATQADEIASKIISGDLDIALVPANLASVLYKKTEGKISVIDINTLGVLYCVSGSEGISSVKDLSGKTVVTTGQGTTPEYSLRYLLSEYGVTDCTMEFASEATEVAAILKKDPSKIAVLPQPFVTVAMVQNTELKVCFSLAQQWDDLNNGSRLVTGVTIVRNDYLKEHTAEVETFLSEHKESAELANSSVEATAELVAKYGIIEKAAIAAKAIPQCNIVCITGAEMKTALSGYLTALYNQNASSIGGELPADEFYYTGK